MKTVYIWFFTHGKYGERVEDRVEVFLNEVPKVTEISHIIAIEKHLGKDYINPITTNYIELRREKK